MTIFKLNISCFCPEDCKCGESGLTNRPIQRTESCSPCFVNIFAMNRDSQSLINWDLSMKNFCMFFDMDVATIGVVAADCPENAERGGGGDHCHESYHTVGKYGQNSAWFSNCTTLSHEDSLSHYSVKKKCIVISNDVTQDPRCRDRLQADGPPPPLESTFCTPLLLPDGTLIGVFGGGTRNRGELHPDVVAKMACTLDYMALALHTWILKRRETILQSEMQVLVKRTIQDITESNRSRDTFIATMSHEIRTPLTSIVAALQLLKSTPIERENREKIERLYRVSQNSSAQLLELINDILDFCKLRSTTLSLSEDRFYLGQVVSEATEMFGSQCKQKGIELCTELKQIEMVKVIGDAKRLKQVILNLLSNALKFTDHGSIVVRAFVQRKACAEEPTDSAVHVKIVVEDTGSGITPKTMKHIFEPYFTEKRKDWTDVFNGVGLGLAISRELVSLMGGTIVLQSDGTQGTAATVEIPFKTSDYMDKVVRNEILMKTLYKEPILVLDDRFEQRMYMMRLTRRWGMMPHSFSNSAEALMALDVLGAETFRVALVDVDLSTAAEDDTGAVFAQSIRSKNFDIKLIAVSSVGSQFGGDQLFDHVLVKPLGEVQLYDTIRKCYSDGGKNMRKKQQPRRNSMGSSTEEMTGGSPPMMSYSQPAATHRRELLRNSSSPFPSDEDLHRHDSPPPPKPDLALKILIVDDDVENASIFREIFIDQMGYENVHVVNSAAECLFKLSESKDWNIVFLDIVMPHTGGIECAKRIRMDSERYGAPKLIALTADALDSTRFSCLQSGFDFFLSKPTLVSDFENAIRWVTHRR